MMDTILSTVDQKEVNKWIDVELIHTDDDREAAKKIVMDHIFEHGLGYYPALIKMENELKAKNGNS